MLERLWKKFLRRSNTSPWVVAVPLFWIVSVLYRGVSLIQRIMVKDSVKLNIPVISVGNIALGGSGKTPVVDLIARHLIERGIRVGIASSGYGRASRESLFGSAAYIAGLDASITGDEVKLLASRLPRALFAVDRVKAEAARRLASSGDVDVILVDDGFQHHRLRRSLDIVVIDATMPTRDRRLFPLGNLREPFSSVQRADLVILNGRNGDVDTTALAEALIDIKPNLKLFQCRFACGELIGRNEHLPATFLKDKSVLLFAGIASFEPLRMKVEGMTGRLVSTLELKDHQRYDGPVLEQIKRKAHQDKCDLLLTTGKDWVKLGGFDFGVKCCYLDLQIELEPSADSLVNWICVELQLEAKKT